MKQKDTCPSYHAIILPPSIGLNLSEHPEECLKKWLLWHHSRGAAICSVCSGAFLLANTGLLHERPATTHWESAHLKLKTSIAINSHS